MLTSIVRSAFRVLMTLAMITSFCLIFLVWGDLLLVTIALWMTLIFAWILAATRRDGGRIGSGDRWV